MHADADWEPSQAHATVRARVRTPGSKSMTNRALVLAALAASPTQVVSPLQARDTDLMAAAMGALGATIERPASTADPTSGEAVPEAWTVMPGWASGAPTIDVGNAGTVLRFVPPAAALAKADVEFTGDDRAAERPVGQLLGALRQAGVEISDGGRAAVPFVVHGRGWVDGGAVRLDASASSQLVSGLMLAAPRFERGLEIVHVGERLPSAPHIAMTAAMLRAAGAEIEQQSTGHSAVPDRWRIGPAPLAPGSIMIEPDLSNAAPFLAAALVTGGSVTVAGWPAVSLQPADQILDVLTGMGAVCTRTPEGLLVGGSGRIRGITADLRDVNELAPVLTALAALADSPSEFSGIGHMRFHETDRLAALSSEIGALGGRVIERPDGLRIEPRPLRAGAEPFDSHADHRMVMAAAVLGLVLPGLRVRNAETVRKTFPDFTVRWQQMLGPVP
ncbi:MAG TPA: 3-phosphoshikimate 1-carboxyvinyltransferase [Streptosporangiaceae bacterium]|jgi:3-phosphoshikimate 1-carboxyvinyltransferase